MGPYLSALRFLLAAPLLAAAGAAAAQAQAVACAGPVIAAFHAVSIRDGSTIVTREGKHIRLAGIAFPNLLDGDAPAVESVHETLGLLVAGKQIFVRGHSMRTDRYGRIIAHVETAGDKAQWIQAAVLSAGLARVLPQMEEQACRNSMLEFEQLARLNGTGKWSDPKFAIHGPGDLAELTAAEGRFMLVEGYVRRVGEAGGRIYLDFGTRFSEDFSVIIPRDANKAFTSAGIDLRSLAGVRLRVRGIVSIQGGPAIFVRHPSALEILRTDGA